MSEILEKIWELMVGKYEPGVPPTPEQEKINNRRLFFTTSLLGLLSIGGLIAAKGCVDDAVFTYNKDTAVMQMMVNSMSDEELRAHGEALTVTDPEKLADTMAELKRGLSAWDVSEKRVDDFVKKIKKRYNDYSLPN